ncbi:MAG: nicotinate-nucleotide adenylyltransferase [Dehalococcoidia bacterium]
MSGSAPVGLFGGTFDPPHFGHLLLAETARAQFELERVLFVPAGDPYRKPAAGVAPAAPPQAMVRLAIAANPAFQADDREVRRQGPSYTIDTLQELAREGIHQPFLLLGSDALADMPNWKDHRRIPGLARIAIAPKGHSSAEVDELARRAGLEPPARTVDMPPVEVSSTVIRARLRAGLPVRYLLPDAVLDYIRQSALYLP